MKLYLKNGELTLPNDFSFEISHSNPFFSEEGSSSAPAALPPTPENFEILGHPEDTHKLSRNVKNYDAQLQSGLFFANCKLVVDSASRKGGVSVSLALKESVMYGELQDHKLTELFAGRFELPGGNPWGIYHNGRPPAHGQGAAPLCQEIVYFPVATDVVHHDPPTGDDFFIVNEPGESDFKGMTSRRYKFNGAEDFVTLPAKYGVVPFLYLWALIDATFELCGYAVSENVFKTDSVLKNIAVLHNTVDLAVTDDGHMHYEQAVPDITVGELVGWLRDKFGAVVCAENGSVSIRLFRDLVEQAYDLDLSPFMRDDAEVSIPEPKRLEIEQETGIESAEPAADSLEDLIAAYSSRATAASQSAITGTGLFYVLPLGKYYYKPSQAAAAYKVGSDAFPYSRVIKDVEAESMKLQDEFVPTVEIDGKYMPYIGASVRRNTDVNSDRDDAFSQPLMICYAHFPSARGGYCGSSYGYNEDGVAVTGYPALTPESLAATFWQRYQSLILNGCPQISCELDIPIETLLSMDIATPKRLAGDLVLIRDLRFTLGDNGISSCEATFQQLASYADALEAPEIEIEEGTLSWKLVSTRTTFAEGTTTGKRPDGTRIDSTDGITDYTQADAPDEVPTRAGIIAMRRDRWLTYTKFTSYKSFLSWGTSSWTGTEHYEEYFISTFNGE